MNVTWQMSVDAFDLSRSWASCALAAGTDAGTPELYSTTLVEVYTHGLRLVASDGVVLLCAYVPEVSDAGQWRDPVAIGDGVLHTALVRDPDKRGLQLLNYLRQRTNGQPEGKAEPVLVRLSLGTPDDAQQLTLMPELQSERFVIEVPGEERIALDVIEAPFPAWRHLFAEHRPEPVVVQRWGQGGVLRAAGLGKFWGGLPLRMTFGGDRGAVLLDLESTTKVPVRGLAMPMRPKDDERDDPARPRLPGIDPVGATAAGADPAGQAERLAKASADGVGKVRVRPAPPDPTPADELAKRRAQPRKAKADPKAKAPAPKGKGKR